MLFIKNHLHLLDLGDQLLLYFGEYQRLWISIDVIFLLYCLDISDYWDSRRHVSGKKTLWTEVVILRSDAIHCGPITERTHLSPDGCRFCKL